MLYRFSSLTTVSFQKIKQSLDGKHGKHVAQAEGLGPVRACDDVDVVGNLAMVGMPAVGQG